MTATVTGPVAFCDIYGFSSLIRKDVKNLSNSIFEFLADLDGIAKQGFQIQHFSDSFVITATTSVGRQEGIKAILEFIPAILDLANARGFALRGGVSYGETIVMNRVALGVAVLKAYEYEHMIAAPIVWLPESEVMEGIDRLIVTMKRRQQFNIRNGGIRSGYLVLPNATNVFESLARSQLAITARDGPATVAEAWTEALRLVKCT